MPELRAEDPRAHFTGPELDALSEEIVALIKTCLTADMGNAPGCRQCMASVAALALVKILDEARTSDHVGEILGIAKLMVTTNKYFHSSVAVLSERAVETAMKDPAGIQYLLRIMKERDEHG